MKANNNVQCVRVWVSVCASAKNAQVLFFHITEQWSKGMLNYAVGSLLFVFCFLQFSIFRLQIRLALDSPLPTTS